MAEPDESAFFVDRAFYGEAEPSQNPETVSVCKEELKEDERDND